MAQASLFDQPKGYRPGGECWREARLVAGSATAFLGSSYSLNLWLRWTSLRFNT